MVNYKRYFIFVGYVFLVLLIRREFHPFSRFPMYDRFPNWGYVFYVLNERNEIVPYKKKFSINKDAGNVAHNFYTYSNQHHLDYGNGIESEQHLKDAGKEMMAMIIKNEPLDKLNCDTLKLYRRYYFLENDEIKYKDDLMYAQRIKQ